MNSEYQREMDSDAKAFENLSDFALAAIVSAMEQGRDCYRRDVERLRDISLARCEVAQACADRFARYSDRIHGILADRNDAVLG